MSRQQKGWCVVQMLVSERLYNKEVLPRESIPKTWRLSGEKFDKVAEKAIEKHVRRVVLTMKFAELSGRMSLDKAERCVIRAFGKAEMMYYGLDKQELMSVIEKERANAEGRKRNK